MNPDWCWEYLSNNVSLQDLYKYPNLPWSKHGLSSNPSISFQLMNDFDHCEDDWDSCIISRFINLDDVINNPHIIWDRGYLSLNKGITVSFIQNTQITNLIGYWDWEDISMVIDMEDVINHPHLPWNLYNLSNNKNINSKVIRILGKDNPGWLWYDISSYISINDVIENLDLPWNWDHLSDRINIRDIMSNRNLPWNMTYVAQNSTITIDIAKDLWLDKILPIEYLSHYIPTSQILEYPDLDWDMYGIENNPQITMKLLSQMNYKYSHARDYQFFSNIPIYEMFMYKPGMSSERWTILSCNKKLTVKDILDLTNFYSSPIPKFGNRYYDLSVITLLK